MATAGGALVCTFGIGVPAFIATGQEVPTGVVVHRELISSVLVDRMGDSQMVAFWGA